MPRLRSLIHQVVCNSSPKYIVSLINILLNFFFINFKTYEIFLLCKYQLDFRQFFLFLWTKLFPEIVFSSALCFLFIYLPGSKHWYFFSFLYTCLHDTQPPGPFIIKMYHFSCSILFNFPSMLINKTATYTRMKNSLAVRKWEFENYNSHL